MRLTLKGGKNNLFLKKTCQRNNFFLPLVWKEEHNQEVPRPQSEPDRNRIRERTKGLDNTECRETQLMRDSVVVHLLVFPSAHLSINFITRLKTKTRLKDEKFVSVKGECE